MGEFKVNDNGVWKSATPYVNDNGVWKQSQEMYVNDNSVWKKVYPSDIVASNTLVYAFQPFNWYTDYTAYKFTITRSGTARFDIILEYNCYSATLFRSNHSYYYTGFVNNPYSGQTFTVDLPVTAGEVFYTSIRNYDSGYGYSGFKIYFDTTDGHTVGIIDGDICSADFTGTPQIWY